MLVNVYGAKCNQRVEDAKDKPKNGKENKVSEDNKISGHIQPPPPPLANTTEYPRQGTTL